MMTTIHADKRGRAEDDDVAIGGDEDDDGIDHNDDDGIWPNENHDSDNDDDVDKGADKCI